MLPAQLTVVTHLPATACSYFRDPISARIFVLKDNGGYCRPSAIR